MKATILGIAMAFIILVGGIFVMANIGVKSSPATASADNVTMRGDLQIIEIQAKGGYLPRISAAKAGVPTILKFNTNGTFDCSASVRIPSMNISKLLPSSGATEISLGSPQAGPLRGTCGMGMYQFEIDFQS